MQVWNVRDEKSNVNDKEMLEHQLSEPAAILRDGGLVAFPTETVYGLGADATNEAAVRGIFAAKGRPADNPLIVHIADETMLDLVVENRAALPAPVLVAMEKFWPGPLTLILPAHASIAPSVRPGMDSIGVRMPDHPVASALIRRSGRPIAAPSANKSGKPSPTTAADVMEDMDGVIDGIVDGGDCAVGVESTVVAISDEEAVIYRPGGISQEQLAEALGIPVKLDAHLTTPTAAPKAPGMKYRHYAPNAQVHVWWGADDSVQSEMASFLHHASSLKADEKVAVVVPRGWALVRDEAQPGRHGVVRDTSQFTAAELIWEAPADEPYPEALTRELYRLLRRFDRAGAAHILIAGVPPEGIGAAVMNRLQKASEGRLYRV